MYVQAALTYFGVSTFFLQSYLRQPSIFFSLVSHPLASLLLIPSFTLVKLIFLRMDLHAFTPKIHANLKRRCPRRFFVEETQSSLKLWWILERFLSVFIWRAQQKFKLNKFERLKKKEYICSLMLFFYVLFSCVIQLFLRNDSTQPRNMWKKELFRESESNSFCCLAEPTLFGF